MTSRVGIVREQWVNDSDLANFEPIGEDYDLSVIGASGIDYGGNLEYRTLWSPASFPTRVLMRGAQALSSLTTGSSTYMRNLPDFLADYDLAHTLETFQGFSEQCIEAKRRHGTRVVCTVWENIPFFIEDDHYSRTILERLKHRGAPEIKPTVREHTDAFLPVTERAKFALEAEGVPSDKIHVVPMGVDPEMFRPGRLADSKYEPESFGLSGDPDTVDVVFLGRYPWHKGPYDTLSAWRMVEARADRPVKLTMIGTDDRDSVADFADHADVPAADVYGPIPYETVPLAFDAADVAIVPSVPVKFWQEQYGRVILEAQATGTPVLASATGGIPEAMGEPGVLCHPGDAYDIAEKLLDLISDPDRREELGTRGRERILASRTLEHTAERIEDVYDSVLSG